MPVPQLLCPPPWLSNTVTSAGASLSGPCSLPFPEAEFNSISWAISSITVTPQSSHRDINSNSPSLSNTPPKKQDTDLPSLLTLPTAVTQLSPVLMNHHMDIETGLSLVRNTNQKKFKDKKKDPGKNSNGKKDETREEIH